MRTKNRRAALLSLAAVMALLAAACLGSPNDEDADPAVQLPLAPAQSHLTLVDWADANPTEGGALRTLDPTTGATLPGREPFDVGHHATLSYSPDGRLLAANIGRTSYPNSKLHIFDVQAWEELFVLEEPADNIGSLSWSPDSSRLYLTAQRNGASQLWEVDIANEESRMLTELDFRTDRTPTVSRDGETIYFFAFDLANTHTFEPAGDPYLLALDAESGIVSGRVDLPGVSVGQRLMEGEERSYYALFSPGTALSPDGGRYYVAHPDENKVTVVDLEEMRVERSVEIEPKRSLWEDLTSGFLGLFASRAEAKGGASLMKGALVSPDGRWLYVTGLRQNIDPAAGPRGSFPLGLQVIDTETMRLVHEEEGITSVTPSPDGRWLYATGWGYEYGEAQDAAGHRQTIYRGWGLKVLDARTNELVQHFNPQQAYHNFEMSADGRYIYLMEAGPGYMASMTTQGQCAAPCHTLYVLDAASRELLGQREVFSSAVMLRSSYRW